ncbi:MAG: hydroxyacid dehydrogenase [Coleofasciculus sp. C1-SOL-03]|uniref:hydroxyacid dehydrogenase n=1 Tax=Coleofasciculus sp. C1-SOL-03 TaxID=3069522 RepID=UPI0032FA2BD3
MKIIAFNVESWEQDIFQKLSPFHQVECVEQSLTTDNASHYADADIISTFIYSDLSTDVLKQFNNLQMIATRSTGFDHIDTDYCQDHGIKVCNVPTYGENTVAEHVFALLLALSHNLIEATDRTRKGDFSQVGLQGFDLRGKTLGVIGTGNIGQCVIEIAKGFRMEVVAFDVKPKEELASRLGFRYAEMKDVLSAADIVTLHVPANPKTHHLISTEQFDAMKDGVILINTSRGPIVDINALLQALAEGKVAAAGLDVLPEEPVMREEAELLRSVYRKQHDLETLLADHVLLRLRNVIVTPHSAFNTREAVQRIIDTTVENIDTFAEGNPQNVVA